MSAAQQLASGGGAAPQLDEAAILGGKDEGEDDIPELEAVDDDAPVDETGVDPKDIELVMQQVNCSRGKAVRVLKESGGDLINASACLYPPSCFKFALTTMVPQSWLPASSIFVFIHSRLSICIAFGNSFTEPK